MRLKNLLRSLFLKKNSDDIDLPELYVRDFMKPRSDVEFVQIDDDVKTIADSFVKSNDIVLPVVSDTYNVIGYIKAYNVSHYNAVLPTCYIPENIRVNRLLSLLIEYDLIVVTGEDGFCSGIVTKIIFIENLLQKFILSDNIDNDSIIVSGDVYISEIDIDFSKYVNVDDDTVSSFVINLFDKMPEKSEFIIIGPYKIEVLAASDNYVEKICIHKIKNDKKVK